METGIYGRVSTDEQAQEGYSIRAQVEKLKAYVSAKSWTVYDVYLDEGISGKNITERPAINRLIDDVKAGKVKNVLIFKLDRLTRSVADLVYLIDLFKQYGCAFNSLSESIDTSTASGRMFIKIIGIFAEFERENIAERVRLGRERKAREGYTLASKNISYGYQREQGEKVQTIIPHEAKVIQRIYDMYLNENMSLNKIARELNAEKIPTKQGSIWNSGTIRAVLVNCNNMGYVRYSTGNRERFFQADGKHEAIITEEEFNAAQILIAKNGRVSPTRQPKEQNYFAGFLYCGLCGRKLVTRNTVKKKESGNKTTLGFSCMGRMVKACESKHVTKIKLERALIDYFNNISGVEPDTEKEEKAKEAAAARIEVLRDKLTGIDTKEKEITELYLDDNATLAEYRSVKTMLDGERGKLLAEIEKLTPKEINMIEPQTKEEIILKFKSGWENFSDKEKRQFLLNHISKITVINKPVPGSQQGIYEILEVEYNTN